MIHLQNLPNRETQIPRYHMVQIQNEILVSFNLYEEFEILNMVSFRGVAFWVESVIQGGEDPQDALSF